MKTTLRTVLVVLIAIFAIGLTGCAGSRPEIVQRTHVFAIGLTGCAGSRPEIVQRTHFFTTGTPIFESAVLAGFDDVEKYHLKVYFELDKEPGEIFANWYPGTKWEGQEFQNTGVEVYRIDKRVPVYLVTFDTRKMPKEYKIGLGCTSSISNFPNTIGFSMNGSTATFIDPEGKEVTVELDSERTPKTHYYLGLNGPRS